MIRLSRLNRQEITLNSDLIGIVEATPDTTLHLITGESLVVRESVEDVIQRIVEYRGRVLSGAGLPAALASGTAELAGLLDALRRAGEARELLDSSNGNRA